MKRFSVIYLLLITVIYTGCLVSKETKLPNAAPLIFRGSAQKDSIGIGELPLKNFINDLSLQRLIDTALLRNIDMQIALKNIDAAEVLFKQTKLNFLPELKLNIAASLNRPSDNSFNGISLNQFTGDKHIEDYNANVGLLWEADIWGKIRSQKRGAYAAYLQSTEVKKAVQTRLVAEIAQGYYNLLMLDAQMEVAKKNLNLNDSTLKIINLQYNAGQITSLAIQQAEAQQLNAAQLIPRLAQNITIQENAMSTLVGTIPQAISRERSLTQMSVSENIAAGFPSSVLKRRPDIKAAELALSIANAKVGVAQASLYPSLSITASAGVNAFKANNWFNIPASLFGLVSGGITQPIFQRGRLKADLALAKIDREKAVIAFRQSVLDAVGEVSDELTKVDQLKTQYDIAAKRTKSLQLATKNASLLFKSGMANYLEVITAQGNLLQSELELTAIKTEQLNAVVGLYRSLGGGWN